MILNMKQSEGNKFYLNDWRVGDSKVFTGRDRGKYVREKSKIDEVEAANDTVDVIIPEYIFSINPSFLEELFVNIVKKLGKEGFYEKFNFINEGKYNYKKPLSSAVNRILRKNTALD